MPVTIDVPGLGPVSIPDNIPSEQADQYVRQVAQQRGVKLNLPAPAPAPAPEKSYGFGAAAQDLGASLFGVVPSFVETVGEWTPADRALDAIGAEEGIAGIANFLNAKKYGKDVDKYGVFRGTAKSLRDVQEGFRTEQSKAAQKELARKQAEQEGELGKMGVTFKETLTTPELFFSQAPESIASMLVGSGEVKGLKQLGKIVAPKATKELSEKISGKVAEKIGAERLEKLDKLTGGAGTREAVLGGALVQGASVSNQNFMSTMDMPQNKLAATQEYQEAIASGMTPEEARLSVARGAANGALLPATAISIVSQYAVPGGSSFERLLAGATERTLGVEGALQVAKQIGKSSLGEAGSEMLEEGGGQFVSNVFTPGQEDLTQGVGAAAGAAGALGALMGGGAGGINALQAQRAQKVIEERKAAEEQAKQELDARTPPVEQIEHPDPVQLAPEQVRNTAQELVSNIQPGSAFTLDDITNTTGGAIAGADAAAVANDLLNRGEIVREPGDTLSFRRVNDDERVIPLGNPDQSYVYTVPTTRDGSEINDGYAVESQALGVIRNVANQEEADQLKQLMLNRAGEQAAVVDEQINNLREQEQQVTRTIEEAMLRSDVTSEQLQGLKESGQQASEKIKQEIAKLEEQKAAILAEPVVTPINPRAEAGHQVRLHIPGQSARVLSNFATEQEAYDAIIDNASPEQERSIVEDPAYEGVRNRLEERAAQLEEEPEEAPVEMTPEMQQRVTEVSNRMRGVLDQMGLKGIGLNVQQRLQEAVNGKLSAVDGHYLNRVISASLEGSRDVTATIGHETIHALRELGMFSDKEWEILTKKAKSEWIKKYDIESRYEGVNLSDEKVIEEAIADAFGDWLQGNLQERGVVSGLFNRIKLFLQKVGDVLRGQGFTNSEDVFKRARTGTLEGDRVERTSEGTQFARDFKDVTARTPELQEAAKRVAAGEMTGEEYNKLVNQYKAITPYTEVPMPASDEEAINALTKDKRPQYRGTNDIPAGERVDLRLDIPAYRDHGVWVNSVHREGGKKTVYGPVSSVKNAQMAPSTGKALKVATGAPKSPFAVIRGNWVPVSDQQAVARAKEYLNNPEWAQVGYDPERHGYFYDRSTTQPIVAAEEILQIGPLVLAKNPTYEEKSEFQYALPRTVNVDGKELPTRISENAHYGGQGVDGYYLMDLMGFSENYWNNLSNFERNELFQYYYRLVSGAGKLIYPTVEGIQNFYRWFSEASPDLKNDDGTPVIWYHGTAQDVHEFRSKQAGATFVTRNPVFANTFAGLSKNWMVNHAWRFAKEPMIDIENAFYEGAKEAFKNHSIGKIEYSRIIEDVIPELTDLLLDYTHADAYGFKIEKDAADSKLQLIFHKESRRHDAIADKLADLLPSKENIISLFVSARNPFDYAKEEHIQKINDWWKSQGFDPIYENTLNEIRDGDWRTIESEEIQKAIKGAGFDAFYMYENFDKNLAVYDTNQVKSAIGNTGAFSRNNNDIQYALPLSREEKDDIVKRARGDADLAKTMLGLAANMTPEERLKLDRANAVKMVDLLGTFPTADEYAAVAYAGRAKRGWYENSAKALVSVFGSDAPRFAALLAALSPQCSVQTNLLNTLNMWKNWTAAGGPTNTAEIIRIFGKSVQGKKEEKSVLNAWKNNAIRALTAQNFSNFKLSGPKVNSFYLNLIGVTEEVTNDTWMANFAFVEQKLFSGSLNKKETDPGKGVGYLATNVVVRQAADRLTELTGEKWTPAEVQETVWSWAKALYEGAEAADLTPIQFLNEGKLTDELINSVPDFKSLFFNEVYESILREAGYGKQLDGLVQQRNADSAKLSKEGRGLGTETAPFTPTAQKEFEQAAAKRLTALENLRQKESTLNRIFHGGPIALLEVRPSTSLSHLVPSLNSGDRKLIKQFTSGAKAILFDSDGKDRVAALLGFDSGLPKKKQEGEKKEENKYTIGSGGFEGVVSANYQVKVPEEYADPYCAASGYVFLQDAVPWQKPDPNGWGFGLAITIPKLTDEIESEFFERFEALTDTGHTRKGNTIFIGNFTEAGKTKGGLEKAEINNELFEELVLQLAHEIAVKHQIRTRVSGYRFGGGYLSNYVENADGQTVNAWAAEGTGAGYLRGDGGERLANIQEQLDALQAEFRDYCRAFQEEQDRKAEAKANRGKGRVKKEIGQLALPRNVLGQPATLPTWTDPTDSKTDDVRYLLQDKMIDVKRVVQEITKAAGVIADRWNPYLQEELYHGRTAQQTERFLRTELRPLLLDLAKHNITTTEFEEFLHNRHAKERNDQIASINPSMPDAGSGIATQAAQNYLNALPPARRRLLDSIAQKIDNINRGTRQILVKSGLETPQTIASWEQTYPNYVPLFREDADYVTSSGYGVGQGFNIRGDFSKRTTGSTRNVVDILANVVMQRERAIVRAEKNRVAESIYGLAVQNPNKDFWLAIDPDAIKDVSKIQNELIGLGISPNDIQNIFQQPKKPTIDPRTGLVTNKLDPFVLNSDNILATRINGRNHYVLFNNNNPRAKRMVTALKNLDADQLGRVMNFMGKISRWVSSINTQYNPIFGVVNLFRDVQGAVLNLSTTPIAGKAGEVMNLNNLKDAMGAIWSTARAERSGSAAPNTQWAKLWQEFQEEGGQTGYRSQFSSSQERADELQSELNKISEGKLKHAGRAMFDLLSDYNTTMENAVRLSAYKSALAKGLSKQQAASIAKNLTVNFNRKGQIATQAGALYSFFNASMQGTARLVETMRGPAGVKILLGGFLLGAVQAAMLAAAGFDDDEPPEFIKERNFIIPIGGKKYISIPLPLGYNVIPNFSRHITEIGISGGKHIGDHIVGITGSFVESFNPIGGAGWSLQTIFPTAADPFIALAENKDSFGRPIYRENFSNLDPTPGYLRTKDSATAFSKGLSEFLNAASGGTKYKPGVVDVTPDQIDYLLGQAGGGVFRELQKTEQTITGTIKGEEVAPYKIPLVGRFYGNAESNAAKSQLFYKNLERLNEHENEIKGRLKNHEPIAEYLKENPEARLIKMSNSIEYNIRKLKQRRELLKARGGNEQAIKNINDSIVRLMVRLNERVSSFED